MSGGNTEPLGKIRENNKKVLNMQDILAVINENQIVDQDHKNLDEKLNQTRLPDKEKLENLKTGQNREKQKRSTKKGKNKLNLNSITVLNLFKQKTIAPGELYLINENNQEDSKKDKNLGKKTFARFYIKIKSSFTKSRICLIDNGADVSVIFYPLLVEILGKTMAEKSIKRSDVTHLGGFTQGTIKVAGKIQFFGGFSKIHDPLKFTFLVVKDKPYYNFLFGADNMRVCQMGINYLPDPVLTINFPVFYEVPVKYSRLEDLHRASGKIDLGPKELNLFEVQINEFHSFLNKSRLLVSQDQEDQLRVFPTRSELTNGILNVCIENPTNDRVSKHLKFECEEISDDFDILSPEEVDTEIVLINQVRQRSGLHDSSYLQLKEDLNAIQSEQAITKLNCNLINSDRNLEGENHDTKNIDWNQIDASNVTEVDEDLYQEVNGRDKPFGFCVQEFASIEDLLKLDTHPKIIQPYLKKLILEKYPEIVSRSPYDLGDLSNTLGLYKIELKEGVVLPKFKKLYYCSGNDLKAIQDILMFLLKYKIIERTRHNDPATDYASPAYLVPKPDLQKPARLIIDYKILNDSIVNTPPVIPDSTTILHSLSGMALFTSSDLSQAYFSLSLDKNSQYLTKFATQMGCFQFKRLSQGLSVSPSAWGHVGDRMINYEVLRDEETNEIIFDEPNVARMKYDPLPNVHLFYDDILIASPPKNTYEETLETHFALVDKVLQRLHIHKAKLSLEKTVWARTKILYLGWCISANKISVDPKRVQGLLETPMFTCKKGARSWLGLLNTLKSLLPVDFTKEISVLTPLTSSSKIFKVESQHIEAFENLKKKLIRTPVFANMVDPVSPKYLWTDAAEGAHAYEAGVLTQVRHYDKNNPYLPPYLDINNPVDAYIYDKKLQYQPARIFVDGKFDEKISLRHKKIDYLTHPYLGYTEEQFRDSLFISVQSIQREYNCSITSIPELRKTIVKDLKVKLTGLQMRTFSFDNNQKAYKTFLEDFTQGKITLDKELYILECLHRVLRRKTIFIKSEISTPRTIVFGTDYNNPEFVFGMHKAREGIAFRPYFIKRYKNFDLNALKGKLEIVGFFCKPVPQNEMKLTIKELEINALLDSLAHYRKLIGGSELTALVDNQSLVLIFSSSLRRMFPKYERWSNMLRYEWPNLKIHQITSLQNISDFMTRRFEIQMSECKRLPLKCFDPSAFKDVLEDQVLTVDQFFKLVQSREDDLLKISDAKSIQNINLVHSNGELGRIQHELSQKDFTIEELFRYSQENEHRILLAHGFSTNICSVGGIVKDIEPIVKPLTVLQKRMSHKNIQLCQRVDMEDVYNKCLTAPDFKYRLQDVTYVLHNGLIFVEKGPNKQRKICLPESLHYLFISYYHCASSHSGYERMMSTLDPYFIPLLSTKLKRFLRACWVCFRSNANTYSHKVGSYPTDNAVLRTIYCDLAEDLPQNRGYKHILICCCGFSSFVMAFPLKSKSSEEVAFVFANSILPFLNPAVVISDNGPAFKGTFAELLENLNIKKPQTAVYHPQSNGRAESTVKKYKVALTKILTQEMNYNWPNKLFLITKMLNSTVNPKLGLSPLQMLFGTGPHCETLFTLQNISEDKLPTNVKIAYLQQAKNIKKYIEKARLSIIDQDMKLKDRINKNKCTPNFRIGDYAFVKDRRIVLGVNTSLRPKFSEDVWIVLSVAFSTVVLCRLADGMQNVFSKEDVKIYKNHEPNVFIPAELKDILSMDVKQYDKGKFEILRKFAKFDGPELAYPVNQMDSDGKNLLDMEEVGVDSDIDIAIPHLTHDNEQLSNNTELGEQKNNILSRDDNKKSEKRDENSQNDSFVDDNDIKNSEKKTNVAENTKDDSFVDEKAKSSDELLNKSLPVKLNNEQVVDEIENKGKPPLKKRQLKEKRAKQLHRYNTRNKPHENTQQSDSDSDEDRQNSKPEKTVRFENIKN